MKKINIVQIAAFSLLVLSSCKEVKKEQTTEAVETTNAIVPTKISFTMEPKSASAVTGEVTFIQEDNSVTMTAELSGLEEGEHAIHIHQTADCSSADGKSTGGHWNPTNNPHGKWGAEEGFHKGDIGNFMATAEGSATVTFITDEWCIGCDDENKNIIGKGVIVHNGVDDFTSQPSGAAGARISCAGIIQ